MKKVEDADILLHFIKFSISNLRKYQDAIESFLQKEKDILDKSYNKGLLEIKQNDKKSYNKLAFEYYKKSGDIVKTFPNNFRSSFLIQIISFVEHELKTICSHNEIVKKTKYSIDDLKGNNDIIKAKIFLEKSCNIDFFELGKEWNFIINCKRIRNKFVHYQGLAKKNEKEWKILNDFNNKKQYYYFSPNSDLTEESKLIIQSRRFIDNLLDVIELFFNNLLTQE